MYTFSCIGMISVIILSLVSFTISIINIKFAKPGDDEELASTLHSYYKRNVSKILNALLVIFAINTIASPIGNGGNGWTISEFCIAVLCTFSLVLGIVFLFCSFVKEPDMNKLIYTHRNATHHGEFPNYEIVYMNSFKKENILIAEDKYKFIGIHVLLYTSTLDSDRSSCSYKYTTCYYIIFKNPIAVFKYTLFQIKIRKSRKEKAKMNNMSRSNLAYAKYIDCVQSDIDHMRRIIDKERKEEEAKIMNIKGMLKK